MKWEKNNVLDAHKGRHQGLHKKNPMKRKASMSVKRR